MANRTQTSAWRTVLLAGLTAGALDLLFALTFYGLKGIGPERLLQGIATGLFGRGSFQLGLTSLAVGLLVHFFASICAALLPSVKSSVSTGPGATALTVMRREPSSLARMCVIASTPALVAA